MPKQKHAFRLMGAWKIKKVESGCKRVDRHEPGTPVDFDLVEKVLRKMGKRPRRRGQGGKRSIEWDTADPKEARRIDVLLGLAIEAAAPDCSPWSSGVWEGLGRLWAWDDLEKLAACPDEEVARAAACVLEALSEFGLVAPHASEGGSEGSGHSANSDTPTGEDCGGFGRSPPEGSDEESAYGWHGRPPEYDPF
jgi:hypothetical protein